MEEKQKQTCEKKKWKKENFVVVLLAGILLLVIAWPTADKSYPKGKEKSGITDTSKSILEVSEVQREEAFYSEAQPEEQEWKYYTEFLEQTLEELLSTMEGAGKVKVMITLEASSEAVVEKDVVRGIQSSTEVDSEGGSRNTGDSTTEGETVFTSAGSGISSPYVKQVISPPNCGSGGFDAGGGNETVNKNITEAIQALFGIEVHKIKVIKMSSK